MDREKWRNGLAAAQALGLGTGRFLLFGMWPGRRGLPSFFFLALGNPKNIRA